VIARQIQHLARLVDDLLDVSRVTTGKVVLDRQPCDLAELVDGVVVTYRASGRLGRHRVSVELSPVWADADATRIEQVISNLLANALKYTPADGEIAIRLVAEAGYAVLTVTDTGIGIPPTLAPKVFDLFVQGEQGLDRAQGGLGIGLTLVKRLVELHGGTVAVSSTEGIGSVFTVRLPQMDAPLRPADSALAMPGRYRPLRILVIEDDADARQMLRASLILAGHDVDEATNGVEGVARALSTKPEAVIVDIGLPGLEGYEVARRIRASAAGRAPRLIALTGYGQHEDRRRAYDAGFDVHLVKPVTAEALQRVLAETVP
jgi:CheY-like chemotaxis protein